MSGIRRALTLLELLVAIAVISLLVSILLPSLRAARIEADRMKCLANIRSIVQCSHMYADDQGGQPLFPWYQIPPHPGYDPDVLTPWAFGGFQSPAIDEDDLTFDSQLYPAQIRPLNKYADPGARGKASIGLYVDPGDRSYSTAFIGEEAFAIDEELYSAWQKNGSSYTLNTRFAQGYAPPTWEGVFTTGNFMAGPDSYADRLAPHLVGGNAARFIFWVEQGFYSATYNAGPTIHGIGDGNAPQRVGWHRKWSSWCVGFYDGHCKSGYYDTRTIYGLDGTIWQP